MDPEQSGKLTLMHLENVPGVPKSLHVYSCSFRVLLLPIRFAQWSGHWLSLGAGACPSNWMEVGKRTRDFAFVFFYVTEEAGRKCVRDMPWPLRGRMQYDYKQTNKLDGSETDMQQGQ